MSIWTCKRGLLAAVTLIALAGCAGGPEVMRRATSDLRMPPETVSVARRSVVVGGPAGYCVDRRGSRLSGGAAFVLLGSCASIAQDARAGAPRVPGVLMATVDDEASGAEAIGLAIDQLEAALGSPAGRAALARDGRAGSVTVLDSRREGDALFVYLRDTGEGVAPGLAQDYWRGVFGAGGHLVTASVVGFADSPMTTDTGLGTLRGFVERIRQETRQKAAGGTEAANRPLGTLFN